MIIIKPAKLNMSIGPGLQKPGPRGGRICETAPTLNGFSP